MEPADDLYQTSFSVSPAAIDALRAICDDTGVKREPTVRRLLQVFIEHQQAAGGDRRLTHISTALRYPPGRSGELAAWPEPVRLPVRISRRAEEQASALTYRIPGHARRQAHRDYTSRPLADAVLTAIALEHPFTDPGLDGLPPLLEHRAADGLWRLVAAATLTEAERRAHAQGPPELVLLITESDHAWDSPWRAEVALHLARRFLTGPDGADNLRWISEQREDFAVIVDYLSDPKLGFGEDEYTTGAPRASFSHEGRGATMVWRARRTLAKEEISDWLTSERWPALTVDPPGWDLVMPPGWHALTFPGARSLPPQVQRDLDNKRILRIDHGGKSAVWPVTADNNPIPGFNHVLTGAQPIGPVELAEALLVDGDAHSDDPAVPHINSPRIPASTAHQVGLIGDDERAEIEAAAAAETRNRVTLVLKQAAKRLDPSELGALHDAADHHQTFGRLAEQHHLVFWITPPVWTWDIDSVPEALAGNPALTPGQLRLLGQHWWRQTRRSLEQSMENAHKQAIWWAQADAAREAD